MRHNKKFNHLSRKKGHREALLSNLAISLIMHKRIFTTVAKAKALRVYAEPLITRSKSDDTSNRRLVFSYLQNKEAVKELFGVISEKVATRPGGYLRILKTGHRLGDNAEMAMIEFVDFNENMLGEAAEKKQARTRRSRSRKAAAPAAEAPAAHVPRRLLPLPRLPRLRLPQLRLRLLQLSNKTRILPDKIKVPPKGGTFILLQKNLYFITESETRAVLSTPWCAEARGACAMWRRSAWCIGPCRGRISRACGC